MPGVDVVVECGVKDSFRVRQVAGLFDLPVTPVATKRFAAELPSADEPWQVGAIVGPSGSGKSTIARQAFGPAVWTGCDWPADAAVVDAFDGDLSIHTITSALTAVGFASPPAWLKPYAVLSNGERFRCDLARALASSKDLVVFDEFTSVVDRTVAKVASAAVARAVRQGNGCRRFVAVSCHDDIVEWLEPDWVLDLRTGTLARGWLRRPKIELELYRCDRSAWRVFGPHHYLSATLHPACKCYLATWNGREVAFVATLHAAGIAGRDRVSRLVVPPDYQGVGIGRAVLEAVCDRHAADGRKIGITTSHPMLIHALKKNERWRCTAVKKTGGGAHAGWGRSKTGQRRATSSGRAVVAFDYIARQNGGRHIGRAGAHDGHSGRDGVGDGGHSEMQAFGSEAISA